MVDERTLYQKLLVADVLQNHFETFVKPRTAMLLREVGFPLVLENCCNFQSYGQATFTIFVFGL